MGKYHPLLVPRKSQRNTIMQMNELQASNVEGLELTKSIAPREILLAVYQSGILLQV